MINLIYFTVYANANTFTFIVCKCHQHLVVSLTDNFADSANNFALKAKRKTLGAPDIFAALEDMEFEEFIPKLKDYLEGNKILLLLTKFLRYIL